MSSLSLIFSIGYMLIVCSANTLAIEASADDSAPLSSSSLSSSTTTLPTVSSSSSSLYTPKSSLNKASSSINNKPWPMHQQSGPINYYQFAHSPSYNFRSPLPSSQSSSFSSLMSNLFSPFNKVMSRRAGGKLFSLADQFNPNPNGANPMSNLEYSGSVGSLEALNDAVNNVMMGLNGLQPNQANQLAGQLGSYLSMVGAPDVSSKNGKKLLDIPKQWYKLLGEKISGASEAAYSATVPLKESFMSTLKSFYSYIKPSRSQSASPFADSANMVAAAAAAAASQDSLLNGATSNSITGSNNQNNPKRRQSDSYSGYYYNNINSKLVQQQQQPSTLSSTGSMANQQQQQQQQPAHHQHAHQQYAAVGARYHGSFNHHQQKQHQHHGYAGKQQQQQHSQQQHQTRSPTLAKMSQQVPSTSTSSVQQPAHEMIGMESQAHPSISKQYLAKHNNNQPEQMLKYDQMLSHMIQAQVQQGQNQFMGNSQPSKHPNALYQKSKEILSRFTKKNRGQQPQYGYNTFPLMTEFPQSYQRLPSQTIAKVSNKLPTLPLVYNHQHLKNQQQQRQSAQSPQSQQTKSQPQQKNQGHQSYYTQQPLNQSPFGIQPVYPPQQQQSGTTSIGSTLSPMSTSTSVSMSMSGNQPQPQYDQYEEPQHIQYNHQAGQNDGDQMNGDDNGNDNGQNGQISVQNNQGSVMYYYDQPQPQQQPQSDQQQQQPGSGSQDGQDEVDGNKK